MKIVFPVLGLEKGGGARYIYQVANLLHDKGHDVEIVIPKTAQLVWPIRAKLTYVENLTPETIPPADFLIANWWPTVRTAVESGRGRVIRLSSGYEPMWVQETALAWQSYLVPAPIIAMSEWHRQIILNNTGHDSTVIHGGVDPQFFHPYPKKSLRTGRKTVFYIARAKQSGYFWKGMDDFWATCLRLKEQDLDFDIVAVIAEPEHEPLTPPVAFELVPTENDQELARLYAQADIFVSTSYFESFSLPQLEAMACGTAVVTTDAGGTRDYTRHGQNCLVVPPGNIDRLSEAIAHLLVNDLERDRLAMNGYESAREWTWQRTADQFEAFLLDIAKGN